MFSFETLIDPIDLSAFFQRYYEIEPLRLHRQDPSFYRNLLSIGAIETWFATGVARWPDVFMVEHEVDIAKSEYTEADDRIDVERLFRRFAAGATIVIHNLERHLPELASLCRASERLFSMPFQTNIYLSPPNAQGFRTHYDTHDVFVLQAGGTKDWKLYDTKLVLPLAGQQFDRDRDQAGDVTDSFTLSTGDLLYCPRGLFHDARSTAEASLHITFGLLGKSWAELLIGAVTDVAIADPNLRRTLPPGFANPGFDRAELRASFTSLLHKLAEDQSGFDSMLNQMIDNFVTARPQSFAGHLLERLDGPELGLDDSLAVRPDLLARLEIDAAGMLNLLSAGCTISLPAFTRRPIEFILAAPRFRIRDLPGDIDDDARLVIARRLLREGLLTRAGAAA